MSRKLVLASVFLAVLSMTMLSAKARGGDPPKDAGGTPTPRKESGDAANPFGGARVAKSDASKPAHKPKVDPAKPKPGSGPKLHGGEKAILKALRQKTSLEFVETPLKDVLDYLSNKHRIPIRIDVSALKDAGVDTCTQVTCKLSGISLRSALEIMLDELQLKWTVHHDVLMITTPTKAESDEYLYTKCYDVTDLLVTAKGYQGQNPRSPSREVDGEVFVMPGMNIASPQAMEPVPPGSSAIERVANGINPIVDLITNTIATKTWQENGGTGTIGHHDCMLVVSQTREVHMQIEQFMDNLRVRRQARPVLSVELRWLWLDAKHRGHLLGGRAKPSNGQTSLTVDRQHLREIAREVPGFHGRVASVSGLPTAIAAGDRRSTIMNAIPQIGGYGVGYQPMVSVPNVGVTAQVRATFVPSTKTAMLDIASIITRWGPERKPAVIGAAWPADKQSVVTNPAPASPPAQNPAKPGPATTPPPVAPSEMPHKTPSGSGFCPIDQPVMPTQQIGTTLRVPLGKPVIVGSITFAPAGDAGLGAAKADPVEVYLIATTSIVRGAKK